MPGLTGREIRGEVFSVFVRAFGMSVVLLVVSVLASGVAWAASPPDDVRAANATVQQALVAARQGDLASAQRAYSEYENTWSEIEGGVRASSRQAYRDIEKAMTGAEAAIEAAQPEQDDVVDALTALDEAQQAFISGTTTVASTAAETESAPSISVLRDELGEAQAALERNDYSAASQHFKAFESTWLEVEGQVKTRSAEDYRQTETDMALADSMVNQRSPEAAGVVARMSARLEPYQQELRYGVFDASIILLREGLEALLVIVALAAVLKRSASQTGQIWLWSGAAVGLLLSIGLGVAIQAFFGSVITPSNREFLEGVTGLFAAGMLIYVSYWLHSKATLRGWQRYINDQTKQVLAGGRLFGIALLAFLAVFREGAETALFYLGMAPSISTADLFTGLAIGFAILAAFGVGMVALGIRVPMRPFFAVASLLVFYLCFKFIGTGLHALQVAGVLPGTSATFLPSVDFLGVYPTWVTTIVQLALLGVACALLLYDGALAMRRGNLVANQAALS